MKQLINVNLTTRSAKDWTPPVLTFGESLTLALRFTKNDEGSEVEVPLTVASLKAGVGEIDARPVGGNFAIKVGSAPASEDNTTDFLPCNVPASTMKERLNDVAAVAPYGAAKVIFVPGSWLLFFGDQSQQVPLEVVNNGLWPLSLGRVRAWQVDGKWVHELRLTQLPVAFTSAHDIVLPPSPVITRIQLGGIVSGSSFNEIQELYIPPSFRGAYLIKHGFAKTDLLSREDGIDAILEALQVLGANNFKVTLPLSDRPTIEFIGDYAGNPQDLYVAEVKQAPPGDMTFTLQFDRAALASALREESRIELPLEIRITATDESGFAGEQVALTLPLTIQAPVIWPELEEIPQTEWMQPASPKTYIPRGSGQILTGNKYYELAIGDGETVEFAITHGLDTDAVFVMARENISGGKLLVNGTDFSAVINSANQVTVTVLIDAPGADAWDVMVIGAATVAAWANDLTVTMEQVTGLLALLDTIDERLTAVEAFAPNIAAADAGASAGAMVIPIDPIKEVLFYRGETALDFDKLVIPDSPPYLLPAILDAEADALTTSPLPTASSNAGKIYQYSAEAPSNFLIPGGGRIRSAYVKPGGFVGCDGRILFLGTRDGTNKNYHPTAFEKNLFFGAVNDAMLPLGKTFEVLFGVQLQLINADSRAQYVLRIEKGTAPAETSPDPVGHNLENIVWSDTPLLEQRIIFGATRQPHFFGTRIQRGLDDAMTCDIQRYGWWAGADAAAPSTANFAIRARLVQFDTENNVPLARGWVYIQLTGAADSEGKLKPDAFMRIY